MPHVRRTGPGTQGRQRTSPHFTHRPSPVSLRDGTTSQWDRLTGSQAIWMGLSKDWPRKEMGTKNPRDEGFTHLPSRYKPPSPWFNLHNRPRCWVAAQINSSELAQPVPSVSPSCSLATEHHPRASLEFTHFLTLQLHHNSQKTLPSTATKAGPYPLHLFRNIYPIDHTGTCCSRNFTSGIGALALHLSFPTLYRNTRIVVKPAARSRPWAGSPTVLPHQQLSGDRRKELQSIAVHTLKARGPLQPIEISYSLPSNTLSTWTAIKNPSVILQSNSFYWTLYIEHLCNKYSAQYWFFWAP